MGVITNDVLYPNINTIVRDAYISISDIIYIKKNKNKNYEINTFYCCYLNKSEKDNNYPPFYQVPIKLTDLSNLSQLYIKLYDLVKNDFIKTKDYY